MQLLMSNIKPSKFKSMFMWCITDCCHLSQSDDLYGLEDVIRIASVSHSENE